MIQTLSDDQAHELLLEETVARLGCHAHGVTYVVPVTYAVLDGALVGHSAPGRKVDMLRLNPNVCVEVDRVRAPDDWESVIGWGRYRVLSGEAADRALAALVARFRALDGVALPAHASSHAEDTFRAPAAPSTGDGVVFEIRLDALTGRFERPPP